MKIEELIVGGNLYAYHKVTNLAYFGFSNGLFALAVVMLSEYAPPPHSTSRD
jgi:hypothetical protein